MTEISYLPFDLLIDRCADGFRARVLDSPVGEATNEFRLPSVERWRRNQPPKAFGGQLFKALFDGEVLTAFRRSLDEARRQEAGLRILLRLSEVPGLASLPWEYLYDESRGRFLSLSKQTALTRYLPLPEPNKRLFVTPPLKILAVFSNPLDHSPLDVQQEWKNLNGALGELVEQGRVALERLERATLPALQQRLRQGAVHILHFVGHGAFDKAQQKGILFFETQKGFSHPVPADRLGNLLHDHRALRLVLLNACQGGQTSHSNAFAGVAPTLVQQGVSAVIAMQFDITDRAAITFAKEFYQAIADDYPVDAAVAEGRRAIYYQGNHTEWGTPALYMRAPDGHLFMAAASHKPLDPMPRVTHDAPAFSTPVQFESGKPHSKNPAEGHGGAYYKERYLDAAMPQQVVVGQSTQLVAMIRLPDSAGLGGRLKKKALLVQVKQEDVESSQFHMEFPLDKRGEAAYLGVWIDIEADESCFHMRTKRQRIEIRPTKDSGLCIFALTPRRSGHLKLLVRVFIDQNTLLATESLNVRAILKGSPAKEAKPRSIISLTTFSLGRFCVPKSTPFTAKSIERPREELRIANCELRNARFPKSEASEGRVLASLPPEIRNPKFPLPPTKKSRQPNHPPTANSLEIYNPPRPVRQSRGNLRQLADQSSPPADDRALGEYERELKDIAEKLIQRRIVLFVGADLPQSITGLPSRQAVADEMANRYRIRPGQPLATVAQQVMSGGKRNDFTRFLKNKVERRPPPGIFYQKIAQLIQLAQPEWIVTTAYHRLLEAALGQQVEFNFNTVVDDSDLLFMDANKPTVLKLYGETQRVQELVVTEQDQNKLLRGRFPKREEMVNEIRRLFRRYSVLFLGYDLHDPAVSALFDEIAGDRFQSTSYALCSTLSEPEMASFKSNRALTILPADPIAVMQLMQALLQAVS